MRKLINTPKPMRNRAAAAVLLTLGLLAGLVTTPAISAQEVINMDIRAAVDPLGDGTMTIAIKMSARQWATWKQAYGSNPSMFKRDMNALTTQYETDNFKLDQNDMDRTVEMSLEARGMAEYLGDGVFEIKTPKEQGEAEIIDNQARYDYSQNEGGSLTMVDQRITLPDGARDIETTINDRGERVVRYGLNVEPGGGGVWLALGLIFGLGGAALLVASCVIPAASPGDGA